MNALESARQRLQAALLAGENTAAHREAIGRLEADAGRRAGEESAQRAEMESDRRRAVSARAGELVAETQNSINGVIAQLPKIPASRKNAK